MKKILLIASFATLIFATTAVQAAEEQGFDVISASMHEHTAICLHSESIPIILTQPEMVGDLAYLEPIKAGGGADMAVTLSVVTGVGFGDLLGGEPSRTPQPTADSETVMKHAASIHALAFAPHEVGWGCCNGD